MELRSCSLLNNHNYNTQVVRLDQRLRDIV